MRATDFTGQLCIEPWRVSWETDNNFNKPNLRGCDFNVLPFLHVFPPAFLAGYDKRPTAWTLHFGWLLWTVIVHTRRNERWVTP